MSFYVKRANQMVEEITNAGEIVNRVPWLKGHFDQFAEDRKVAEDNRVPTSWGPVMGAGEYKRVARFPKPLWTKLMRMADEGLIPDPLKDDRFFYGLLMDHPEFQSYPMRRK